MLLRSSRYSSSVIRLLSTMKRAQGDHNVNNGQKKLKKRKGKNAEPDPVSAQGVLHRDIQSMLEQQGLTMQLNDLQSFFKRDKSVPWPEHGECEVDIKAVSANGLGLGLNPDKKVVVVPFTLPGDKVIAKIYRTEAEYYDADPLKVLTPSADRDDSLVKCQYFGKCAGCQYQMTTYDWQLEKKRDVVVQAYRHLAPKLFARLPEIHATVASPKQYSYRTKLTPHFDKPHSSDFPIGFGVRGRKEVMDIEECAIGTSVVNSGLKEERAKARAKEWKKGATILLREAKDGECVTENKATMEEQVGEYTFQYMANEFFQNNNSILPIVTEFVAKNIEINGHVPKYLVDTYCGCGLFAITCGKAAERVIGVEISHQSVAYARRNAELNGIANAEFIVGQAERIFEHVSQAPDETAVVIDPPRKGCDTEFLDQLLKFSPAKIVYVSCNVHSQARDLEYFMEAAGTSYKIDSLGGFDFFPETYHVEGVAVLSKTNPGVSENQNGDPRGDKTD